MVEATTQKPAVRERATPVGTTNVVDPNPLNWVYITDHAPEQRHVQGGGDRTDTLGPLS